MNDYYVYIYWRLDINEPFYIGKGHDDRWKRLDKRNKHFINILNKCPIICEIIKDNLTENQAHEIECWLINELVFEYGFSIDIQGSNSNDHYCHLVNQTWGGEGISGYHHSSESKIKNRLSNSGKNHVFSKSVICITTKEIFYSLREAGRYYNICHKGILKCCKSRGYKSAGKLSDGTKLVWRYLVWNHGNKFRVKGVIPK